MEISRSGRQAFLKQFSQARTRFEVFAPGRVNLVGEHTDYNGGQVLPFAINLGITLRAALLPAKAFSLSGKGPWLAASTDFSEELFLCSRESLDGLAHPGSGQADLPDAVRASWAKYVAGAAALFLESPEAREAFWNSLPSDAVLAFDLSSSLPAGSGMSSSAALCCALMAGLSLFSGAPYTAFEMARRSMLVEHRFSGTKCGLMDQLAVMCSRSGGFTRINFRRFPRESLAEVEAVVAHPLFSRYTAVAMHTGVTHSLADSEYNQRRAACEEALRLLNAKTAQNAASLGEFSHPQIFASVFGMERTPDVQPALKSRLESLLAGGAQDAGRMAACAAHAILENARVDVGIEALKGGNVRRLDAMLLASHASLRDDYRVSCTELDVACTVAREVAQTLGEKGHLLEPAIVGPRMTGGGFGGSTVQLVHNSIVDEFVKTFLAADNPYTRQTGKAPRLVVSGPHNGLRVAIP